MKNIILHNICFQNDCLKSLLIAILFFLFVLPANCQQSTTMYFMHELPQSNYLNPAVQIPCKIFVGFPLLSSIYAGYSNSFFSYSDVLKANSNSGLDINVGKFTANNGSVENVFAEINISLINFGFIHKDYYFNFDLSDKLDVGLNYPTNLFNFALLGNTRDIGRSSNLNGFALY